MKKIISYILILAVAVSLFPTPENTQARRRVHLYAPKVYARVIRRDGEMYKTRKGYMLNRRVVKVTYRKVRRAKYYRIYRKSGRGSYRHIATLSRRRAGKFYDKYAKKGLNKYKVVADVKRYKTSSSSAYYVAATRYKPYWYLAYKKTIAYAKKRGGRYKKIRVKEYLERTTRVEQNLFNIDTGKLEVKKFPTYEDWEKWDKEKGNIEFIENGYHYRQGNWWYIPDWNVKGKYKWITNYKYILPKFSKLKVIYSRKVGKRTKYYDIIRSRKGTIVKRYNRYRNRRAKKKIYIIDRNSYIKRTRPYITKTINAISRPTWSEELKTWLIGDDCKKEIFNSWAECKARMAELRRLDAEEDAKIRQRYDNGEITKEEATRLLQELEIKYDFHPAHYTVNVKDTTRWIKTRIGARYHVEYRR